MNVLALLRHPQFSPGSIENDRAIMEAVACRLQAEGHEVLMMQEQDWQGEKADLVMTMGRKADVLKELEHSGMRVINAPAAIRTCGSRIMLGDVMRREAIPTAPAHGPHGYWLKRADACAQQEGDVVYARDEVQLEDCKRAFRQRGIDRYEVSAHVTGDVVKFYGVRGTGFFRCFYPTDDGRTKFGTEAVNGAAHHYRFSLESMHNCAERLAEAIGLDVYGGDCIVRADGTFCMIDFNDWPSFSRCREEAADAIAGKIKEMNTFKQQ